MYSYAASIPGKAFLRPEWRQAVEKAEMKRIELTVSSEKDPDFPEIFRTVRSMAENGAIKVASIHLPFGGDVWPDCSSEDETARKEWVLRFRRFLDLTAEAGAPLYTLHGSAEPIRPENRCGKLRALRRTLEEIVPELEKRDRTVNLEMLPRTCLGNCPEELEQAVDGLPACIGLNLDVNHLCGKPEQVPELIPRFGKRLRALHLSDYDGVDECHWYPGFGVLNWGGIIRSIRGLTQDVLLIFECFGFLNVPSFQNRSFDPSVFFENMKRNAFFVENAEEWEKRRETFVIP